MKEIKFRLEYIKNKYGESCELIKVDCMIREL